MFRSRCTLVGVNNRLAYRCAGCRLQNAERRMQRQSAEPTRRYGEYSYRPRRISVLSCARGPRAWVSIVLHTTSSLGASGVRRAIGAVTDNVQMVSFKSRYCPSSRSKLPLNVGFWISGEPLFGASTANTENSHQQVAWGGIAAGLVPRPALSRDHGGRADPKSKFETAAGNIGQALSRGLGANIEDLLP